MSLAKKQILRAAYPTHNELRVGPQACGAQDDTVLEGQAKPVPFQSNFSSLRFRG